MLSRMFMMWGAQIHSFRRFVRPFLMILFFTMHYINVSIYMFLDNIFFPSLRKKKFEKPIVIVGNPRSGTTFLQRFLVENGFGTGMRLWKMLFPSLTMQFFLKPFLPLLEKMSPARHHAAAAHKTSLTGIETDDPALFFRYFDGFFVYGFFLAWAKKDLKEMFDPKNRDTAERDFSYWEKMWKRNLVGDKADRMIPKVFSLSLRVPRFLEKFPDAKILYMARDPLSTVPSGLSLVTGVLDGAFGFWKLPEEKRARYIERLYQGFLSLSLGFQDDYVNNRIPKENIKIVTFDRLMQDFDNLMLEIIDFIGEEPSPELVEKIKETAEKQRAFKSGHKYDFAKFGIDEERVKRDYAPFYETFLN